MKTGTCATLVCGIILLALSERPAGAYYNPQTGRWLSRDPVEERGGSNVYRVAANDTVGKIDILGLTVRNISACNVEVWAYHGFLDGAFDDNDQLKDPTLLLNLKYPHHLKNTAGCGAGAIISCNAKKFAINEASFGVELADQELFGVAYIPLIKSSFNKAKAHAKTICDNAKCPCYTVTVSVFCGAGVPVPGIFSGGAAECNTSVTLDCCTLEWTKPVKVTPPK